jgi:hypothetical protein
VSRWKPSEHKWEVKHKTKEFSTMRGEIIFGNNHQKKRRHVTTDHA